MEFCLRELMAAQLAETCFRGMSPEVFLWYWRENDTRSYSEPVYTGSYRHDLFL